LIARRIEKFVLSFLKEEKCRIYHLVGLVDNFHQIQ
jgi:hypothetical protein